MRVGILGCGNIGSAIGGLCTRHGHDVVVAARDGDRASRLAQEIGARGAADYREAVQESDLFFLCLPWRPALAALEVVGRLDGKVIADCSNPEREDGRGLIVGLGTSGAEEIASRAPGASVVKAFNHTWAQLLRAETRFEGQAPSVLVCGDDPTAKATVTELITSCGLDPVDCGPLSSARWLEPLGVLMTELVLGQGWGPADIALKMLRTRAH